ncbi:MAG TPA: hypothetical protein VES79_00780, partial [Solirubrobacteraceae bacterium]|nr:hypothetical protein [Solirubrobacteraceae bacterium]
MLFLAVLVAVALFPVRLYLTEPREVIVSTPSAYTGTTVPLPVGGGATACADEILFDTDARIARFGATAPANRPGPALEVVARGAREGPYRNDYRSVARVPAGWRGTSQFDVPLRPPRSESFGELCVRNLSDGRVDLVGSKNDRTLSRPTVRIDGEATLTDLQLRLMEPARHSLVSRAARIMTHASTLRPFGAWWWWLLTLAVVTLVPAGIAFAIRSALTADGIDAAPARAQGRPWPSEHTRRRLAAVPGWVLVAAVAALAALYF